jgi:hypothetical protein
MVIMSFMTRTQPQFTEQMWERILLFETLLWVVLAMLVREGPSGLIFNVVLVTTRGKPASRLRFALRELLIVGPVMLFDWFCDQLPLSNNLLQAIGAYGGFVMALTWPALIVASVLISPGRYLIDRFAGTIFVPK